MSSALPRAVKSVSSAIETDDARKRLGTAFVVHANETAHFLLTCAHVVEAIGDHLQVDDQPAKVIKCGDKALDLALLKVDRLANTEVLTLSGGGAAGMRFQTRGFYLEDNLIAHRWLEAELGADAGIRSRDFGEVSRWGFKIDKRERFDKVRSGFSGAPVLDVESGKVVGVVSHRDGDEHGYAISVQHLRQLYPPAEDFLAAAEPSEGNGGTPWLVKTLDHLHQTQPLRAALHGAAGPRLALCEAHADDLPHYLADHVLIDPWPDLNDAVDQAITLHPVRHGGDRPDAFWQAASHALLPSQQHLEPAQIRNAVVARLSQQSRQVFFVSLEVAALGSTLPRVVSAGSAFLAELAVEAPELNLLMLIACQPNARAYPWWWHLMRRWLTRLAKVQWVEPLRELGKPDMQDWYNEFPSDWGSKLRRDQLLNELLEIFDSEEKETIRYRLAYKKLHEEGALERALL